MDRTGRVSAVTMRASAILPAIACLSGIHLSSCERTNPPASRSEGDFATPSGDREGSSSEPQVILSAPPPPASIRTTSTQPERPGSEDDGRLVKFAQDYMRRGGTVSPESLRYLVKRSGDDEWSVTVIDIRAIDKGERVGDFTLHVRRHGQGYEVLYATAH